MGGDLAERANRNGAGLGEQGGTGRRADVMPHVLGEPTTTPIAPSKLLHQVHGGLFTGVGRSAKR